MNLSNVRIFVTGGAGFIGSRLCRRLTAAGAVVTAFDNLHPQVHGEAPVPPSDLDLVVGDVRDRNAIESALHAARPDIVVHLAAETGTGQSADEPARYCDVNIMGTANLIEGLKALSKPPERIVLAATRAAYGEGAYLDQTGRLVVPEPRDAAAMGRGEFDLFDEGAERLTPISTPESCPLRPGSVYGSSKLMQEYLLQQTPAPWSTVRLRLQNVYGPGQSLRNPYTGVLSIFCQQAMDGKTLRIFEDGEIYRDFVFVDDVVDALVAGCVNKDAADQVFNIGSGERTSIRHAAELILQALDRPIEVEVTGEYRAGDIRHAVADITAAETRLGWSPKIPFADGVTRLADWAMEQRASGAS